MQAYGGNNLMNMIMLMVYTSQRNKFKGSGTQSGVTYRYDVTEVPIVSLVAGKSKHNLEMDLKKVAVKAQGDFISFDKVLSMKATGQLMIRGGQLSLTGLTMSTASGNQIDQAVIGIINAKVIPPLAGVLSGIPIPQLNNVFGPGLSPAVISGTVIPGPVLEVSARITGKTGIAAADAPTSADKALLNSGTTSNARIMGMVSASAINVLMKSLVSPMSQTFNKSASKIGFGAGIKGTIKASTPVLKITNGSGKATTTISFSGLKGGIDTPLTSWKWISLPAPDVVVVVTHKLSASGNTGVITLTGVDSIRVSFDWPLLLEPVEALVKGLLNGILALFRGTISSKVAGKKIELFKLPAKIPGTNLNAQLSFDAGGLGYFKGSVRGMIRVKKG